MSLITKSSLCAGHQVSAAQTIFYVTPTTQVKVIPTPERMNQGTESLPNMPKSHSWDNHQDVSLGLSDFKAHYNI